MSFFNGLINRLFPAKNLSSAMRRAGYLKDQTGIRRRYEREQEPWQQHIDNTRRFIVESARKVASHKSVAVLGSGWLLDVPVDELSQMFENVYLVDIVHPEPVKVRARKLGNVHLVEADLTGGAVQMAVNARSFQQFVDNLKNIKPDAELSGYDFVVSVNLLNQLDIIMCDYLQERFCVDNQQLEPVRAMVQQRHIDSLPIEKSCLITDYQQIDTDIDGAVTATVNLLHCKLPDVGEKKEWNWLFDTNQRYSVKNNTTFKVMAFCF
ncbi:MAG: hypothetical protein IKZ99_11895 [Salinivirgaceae bacterium]|nr:hypothetical protein [Salinivirgaceae bacterium]